MLSRNTLPAALAAALATGAVPASAAMTSQTGTPDIAGFQQAKITLDQAVAAAEKLGGGNATRATFEQMNGKSGYLVIVFAANTMKEFWVDPQIGVATPQTGTATASASQEAMDKANTAELHGAKSTLQQAVSMAEQQSGGKAIDAQIEKRNNKVAHDIQVARNGKLSNVWFDPVMGKIEG
jgi:uncharacterized membrane protein YkoI